MGKETTSSSVEEDIVHGGGKSMPLWYDNSTFENAKYSEVEFTVPVPVIGKIGEKLMLQKTEREADLAMINIKDTFEN